MKSFLHISTNSPGKTRQYQDIAGWMNPYHRARRGYRYTLVGNPLTGVLRHVEENLAMGFRTNQLVMCEREPKTFVALKRVVLHKKLNCRVMFGNFYSIVQQDFENGVEIGELDFDDCSQYTTNFFKLAESVNAASFVYTYSVLWNKSWAKKDRVFNDAFKAFGSLNNGYVHSEVIGYRGRGRSAMNYIMGKDINRLQL